MLKPELRYTLLFLVVFSRLIHAESANDILLKNIVNKVNIASSEGRPFQLDAHFTAQINTPLQGHITWKWLSKDISSQEITIGSYHQTHVHKGDNYKK